MISSNVCFSQFDEGCMQNIGYVRLITLVTDKEDNSLKLFYMHISDVNEINFTQSV